MRTPPHCVIIPVFGTTRRYPPPCHSYSQQTAEQTQRMTIDNAVRRYSPPRSAVFLFSTK